MYCHKCGKQLADSAQFCVSCGTATIVPETKAEAPAQHPIEGPAAIDSLSSDIPSPVASAQGQDHDILLPATASGAPCKPGRGKLGKKSRLLIILSACAAALIIAGSIAVPAIAEAGKASSYKTALTHMEDGEYGKAQDVLADLGDYQDAAELIAECQNIMDYTIAQQLMDEGNYQEAKAAFESLTSYSDAKAKAMECRNAMAYDVALGVLESGDYGQAQALFENLGSYKDSASRAKECENRIAYAQAVALMDAGSYADAKILLEPLAIPGIDDCAERLAACDNNIDYAMADTAYHDGRFYTAFKLFTALLDFKDSADRAGLCAQDYPKTGEIYRNSDYSGSAVTLRIETPDDDPRPTLLKVYTADGTHVSSVFIRSGNSPRIKLPANTYLIRAAYGESWYGPEEMFGDDNAVYQTLLFEGGDTYAFLKNYTYTLTLRSAAYGNVGAERESREIF
jgi:tetratricopeptide (TPR) repeat protein